MESSLTGDGISWGEGDDQSFGFFKIPGRFNGGEVDGDCWPAMGAANSWCRLIIVWNDSDLSIVCCSSVAISSSGDSGCGATKESFNLAFGFGDGGAGSTAVSAPLADDTCS